MKTRRGWKPVNLELKNAADDMEKGSKDDDRKNVIAWNIRRKTSVRIEWNTTRLKMGLTPNFS